MVHLPGGAERERDTCRYRRESDVTCSGRAAAHTRRLLKEERYCNERMTDVKLGALNTSQLALALNWAVLS